MGPDSSSEPPGKRPRTRDRRAMEAKLIAAASTVFGQKGYDDATTRGIAELAGCSEALIQRYFNGKEGLLLAVIQNEGGGQTEQTDFFERPLCETLEAEAREVLSHIVAVLARRAKGLRIVLSRVLLDPSFKDEFNRITVRNLLRSGLEARFARYREEGRLDPDFDAGSAAELLIGLGFQLGFVHPEILKTAPGEVDRLVADFATWFGRAFRPDRPEGRSPNRSLQQE